MNRRQINLYLANNLSKFTLFYNVGIGLSTNLLMLAGPYNITLFPAILLGIFSLSKSMSKKNHLKYNNTLAFDLCKNNILNKQDDIYQQFIKELLFKYFFDNPSFYSTSAYDVIQVNKTSWQALNKELDNLKKEIEENKKSDQLKDQVADLIELLNHNIFIDNKNKNIVTLFKFEEIISLLEIIIGPPRFKDILLKMDLPFTEISVIKNDHLAFLFFNKHLPFDLKKCNDNWLLKRMANKYKKHFLKISPSPLLPEIFDLVKNHYPDFNHKLKDLFKLRFDLFQKEQVESLSTKEQIDHLLVLPNNKIKNNKI